MRIQCPYCGERDFSEFVCTGEANVRRSDLDGPYTLERWIDAVHLRNNPAGLQEELWFHRSACRSWLLVRRCTLTHEIYSVSRVEEAPAEWSGAAQGPA
jgi:methylglutamate dehydrogenase subunit B